jgi:hypothetical protein
VQRRPERGGRALTGPGRQPRDRPPYRDRQGGHLRRRRHQDVLKEGRQDHDCRDDEAERDRQEGGLGRLVDLTISASTALCRLVE